MTINQNKTPRNTKGNTLLIFKLYTEEGLVDWSIILTPGSQAFEEVEGNSRYCVDRTPGGGHCPISDLWITTDTYTPPFDLSLVRAVQR